MYGVCNMHKCDNSTFFALKNFLTKFEHYDTHILTSVLFARKLLYLTTDKHALAIS